MKKDRVVARQSSRENPTLDLDFVDFSDIQELEEAIAPLFLIYVTKVGGSCTGASGSGCSCHT